MWREGDAAAETEGLLTCRGRGMIGAAVQGGDVVVEGGDATVL